MWVMLVKWAAGGYAVRKLLPTSPKEGPPLPRLLGVKWPWKK